MSPKRRQIQPVTGTTIFARMTQLATETGAVNLGQGFPDTDGPQAVLEAARRAITEGANQYPPARGQQELLKAICEHQRRWYDIDLDAATQIVVTTGATEAIAASILAFVSSGDEVVMFEPYYDSYAAMVERAGGVRRTLPLRFPDNHLDLVALEAAFSDRTSVVMLNTPHNPTGKVFTRDEMGHVLALAQRYDAIVICDEVYEHLAYAPHHHVPFATLPGAAERTVTLSSGGKTFSTTGWKIGWATGPADLVGQINGVKQFLTFSGGAPLQLGIAAGLRLPQDYFEGLLASMTERRDLLVEGLDRAGFTTAVPEGGYFVLADAGGLGVEDAEAFALELPQRAGVVAVPASVFCDDADAAGMRTVMRFAFCKRPDVLEQAVERLVHTFGG